MLLTLEQIKMALSAVLTTASINIEKLKKYVDSKDSEICESIVGKKVTGQTFTLYDNTSKTARDGAEIFNDYDNNKAVGAYSHAEGSKTETIGAYSHAEGFNTVAVDAYSHVEGYNTIAKAGVCHAEGWNTIASSAYQHVEGKNNIEDASGKYVHIVGNGKDYIDRSNAHTLDWNGNAWYSGIIKVGGTKYDDAKKVATEEFVTAAKDSILLNDTVTGLKYSLQIESGRLVISEISA